MPDITSNEPEPAHQFRITHIFFLHIDLQRQDQLPKDGIEVKLKADVAFNQPEDKKILHVNLRLRSDESEDDPLRVEIVTASVSEFTGEDQPNDADINAFINEHLLVAMSSRVVQLMGSLTAQMGMPPIWLPSPRAFGFDVELVKDAA